MRGLALTLTLVVGALAALITSPTPRVSASEPIPQCNGADATITGAGEINGTSGGDVIVGSAGADVIDGKGGNDSICGGGGDDEIRGGSGGDLMFGQGGNDTLKGGSGNDVILGEGGSDTFQGDSGDDLIFGDGDTLLFEDYDEEADLPLDDIDCLGIDGGDDVMYGGSGNDALLDPCGANQAYGDQGRDAVGVTGFADGGSGNDSAGIILPYGILEDTFFEEPIVVAVETGPGAGDGHAKGGSGRDDVNIVGGVADGGSGNDQVYGVLPGDEVRGGSANDVLHNHTGNTPMTLNGGAGFDECEDVAGDIRISCEAIHV